MIGMDQYELIRTAHFKYGKGVREIAREYGHSRKTVRKALKGMTPRYRREKEPHHPVMGRYREMIDRWLIEDQKQPRKQRHTANRVYRRLATECDFVGGESTVRRYVRLRRADLGIGKNEPMVPMAYAVESGAEVDWGEIRLRIGDTVQKVKIFCMRSKFSGKIFVHAYPAERQEMFFDGHIRAFAFFGGIFSELTYDNLTVAVKKILRGRRRIEQDQFIKFRSYYTFDAKFCAPAKGNEKGGVEGTVGYVRRNFFVPVPAFRSLDECNAWLIKKCQDHGTREKHRGGEIIDDLHDQQKSQLIPNQKKPFANVKLREAKVSKYQIVEVERNMYSVPSEYVGHRVHVHLGCWTVRIYVQNREVACHHRDFRRNHWNLNPFHYLKTLKRKTRAFDNARPLQIWKQNWPPFYGVFLERLRRDLGERVGTQEFIDVLGFHEIYPMQRVENSIKQCVEMGAFRASSVKHMIFRNSEIPLGVEPMKVSSKLPHIKHTSGSVEHYSELVYRSTP